MLGILTKPSQFAFASKAIAVPVPVTGLAASSTAPILIPPIASIVAHGS